MTIEQCDLSGTNTDCCRGLGRCTRQSMLQRFYIEIQACQETVASLYLSQSGTERTICLILPKSAVHGTRSLSQRLSWKVNICRKVMKRLLWKADMQVTRNHNKSESFEQTFTAYSNFYDCVGFTEFSQGSFRTACLLLLDIVLFKTVTSCTNKQVLIIKKQKINSQIHLKCASTIHLKMHELKSLCS